ncbi:hypothetical protein Tsubulata_001758 [Turnera subulata]|uniref:Uncharacterized protein n=1 Tax=Turnera subulata TaxID=218843 RepID=A0A9Q0G3C1_9ROSI|nr:hypothetical protein Tsubulata_001758 [Turnera subulata]
MLSASRSREDPNRHPSATELMDMKDPSRFRVDSSISSKKPMVSSSPSHEDPNQHPIATELKRLLDSVQIDMKEYIFRVDCLPIDLYYKDALTSLYDVPIRREDDPIAFLPKEAFYCNDNEIRTLSANQYNGPGKFVAFLKCECCCEILRYLFGCADGLPNDIKDSFVKLEIARRLLNKAWVVRYKKPSDKVNILCAGGEVALMNSIFAAKVELRKEPYYDNARHHYELALPILEELVGEGNQRVADVNAKLAICYDVCDQRDSAITHYEKALSLYQSLLHLPENQAESSSSAQKIFQSPGSELANIIHMLQDNRDRLRNLRSDAEQSTTTPVTTAGLAHDEVALGDA